MKRFYKLKTVLITIVIFTFGLNESDAQVGIGNVSPQGALDISTLANPNANGLLIPRVALALTTTATILTPTVSEMVYNTATAGDVTPGFYFWDGAKWVRIVTGNVSNDWTNTGNAATTATTNFVGTTDAIDFVTRTNNTEKTRVTSAGNLGIGTPTPAAKLDVLASVTTVNSIVNATGSINDFLQYNVQNTSTGIQAQSGYSATADNGTATTGFAWLGINNSTFNFPTAYNIGGANDVSYIGSGQDMYIANANNTRSIIFSTGRAATPFFNERMRVLNNGQIGINNAAPLAGNLLTVTNNATNLYAINAYNTITAGQAIYGTTSNIASTLSSIEGATNSPAAAGVYGLSSATPTAGFPTPTGLIGGYTGATSTGIRIGVRGISGAASTTGNQLIGVQGSYTGTAGNFFGIGVYGLATGGAYITGNQDIGVVGWRTNNANYSGYFNGNHVIANGTKSASVGTSKGNQLLYVTETPGVWFEDIGRGKLQNGYVKITLDPMFLETVFIDDNHPVSVFLQEEGDSKGLYVIPQKDGFIVKEKQSGTSNIEFSYRIMAKRLNFQDHRFGSDPVWGPGDTRKYNRYATPPPVDYSEKLRMDEYNGKNPQKDLYPEGFIIPADRINQQAISRESVKDEIKK